MDLCPATFNVPQTGAQQMSQLLECGPQVNVVDYFGHFILLLLLFSYIERLETYGERTGGCSLKLRARHCVE